MTPAIERAIQSNVQRRLHVRDQFAMHAKQQARTIDDGVDLDDPAQARAFCAGIVCSEWALHATHSIVPLIPLRSGAVELAWLAH